MLNIACCFPKVLICDLRYFQHESSWMRCSSHGGCGFARAAPSWVSISTGATNARSVWGSDLSLTSATKHKERGQQHRHHLFYGKVLDSIGMMWLFMTLEEENHIISYLKQYSCPWIHGDSQCQSDLDLFVFASPLNAD